MGRCICGDDDWCLGSMILQRVCLVIQFMGHGIRFARLL